MTSVSLLDFRDVLVDRVDVHDDLPTSVLYRGRVFVATKDDPVHFREVTVATVGYDARARLLADAELANALRGEALATISGGQLEGHEQIGEAWTRARKALVEACRAWVAGDEKP